MKILIIKLYIIMRNCIIIIIIIIICMHAGTLYITYNYIIYVHHYVRYTRATCIKTCML